MTIKHNIYYAGAMAEAPPEFKDIAEFSIEEIKKNNGIVKSEHIILLSPEEQDNEQAQAINIFERDLAEINLSDACIADFSYASTGTGMEILNNLALRYIPVLALQKKGTRGTNMVRNATHPNLRVEFYDDKEQLANIIQDYMRSLPEIRPAYERFMMVDSIDGSGKGSIMQACQDWAKANQLKSWDLQTYSNYVPKIAEIRNLINVIGGNGKSELLDALEEWEKSNESQIKEFPFTYHTIPTWDEVKKVTGGIDVLMVREPTFKSVGSIIREELISSDNEGIYDSRSVAHAYSLDREILYKRLVVPALEEGVFVLSDRGVTTSQVYQPTVARDKEGWSEELFLGLVRGLPGNQYAIKHSPGLIVVPQVSAEEAMRRLENRTQKDDSCSFENIDTQKALAQVYQGDRISGFYSRRGTQVVDLVQELGEGPEDTKRKAKEIWNNYLEQNNISIKK